VANPLRVAGADIWKGRWVIVVLENGRFELALVAMSLQEVFQYELEDAAIIGVDVPIGLPRLGQRRLADQLARDYVGPRWPSVFPAPPEAMVRAASYSEAMALSPREGPKISAQAFALRKAILEVQTLALSDGRIHEVHPEVSFVCANNDQHLKWPKTSWNGVFQRKQILADQGLRIPEDLGVAGGAGTADVLDAAIVAWTADRIARRRAAAFPPGSERIGAIWR